VTNATLRAFPSVFGVFSFGLTVLLFARLVVKQRGYRLLRCQGSDFANSKTGSEEMS
jgi:hypothetical protein